MRVVLYAAGGARPRQLWLLYVIAAAQAAFFAVDSAGAERDPAAAGRRELMPAANALGQLGFNIGLSLGPLLGGLLIGTLGLRWAYGLDALSFLAVIYAVWRLPPCRRRVGDVQRPGVASVARGAAVPAGRARTC